MKKMIPETPKSDPLEARLRNAWRRERHSIHLSGLLRVVALAVPLFFFLFVLDRMLDLPRGARWGLLILATGAMGWQVFKHWFSRLRPYDGLTWASRVEQVFPHLNSLLLNYVQLVRSSPAATGSQELFGVVKAQALDAVSSIDFCKTIDYRELRSLVKWAGFALVGFFVLFLFVGDSMTLAAKRYLGANLSYPTATRLVGIPGNQTLAEGADFSLSVRAEGQVPAQGFIHLRISESEPWRKIELSRNQSGEFLHLMNNLESSFQYFVEIGDAVSHRPEDPCEVTVVAPPKVVGQELSVSPPRYTGLKPFVVDNLAGAFPAGSKLEWVVEMSSPIAEARLEGPSQWKQNGVIEGEGTSVRFAFAADQAGVHRFIPRGAALGLETEGLTYRLALREDLEPRVSMLSPGTGIKATANKSLRLTVRASDDYGLAEFAILYRVNGEEDQRRISLGVPPSNDSQKDLEVPRSGTWPLQWKIQDDLPNLRGGDFIEVAIEVTEVAADPSVARKVVTRTCGIEILSLADYQAYVTSRFETLQNDLAETERRETLIRHAIEASLRQSQNNQK